MQELLTVAADMTLVIGIGYAAIGFILGLIEKSPKLELQVESENNLELDLVLELEENLEELFPEVVEKEVEVVSEVQPIVQLPNTRDELRAIAKGLGISKWSRMSKLELIAALS